jgi:GNAT superfamily N-acetyltransferase
VDAVIELFRYASKDGEYKGFDDISYQKQKDLISHMITNTPVFVVELSGEVREHGKEPEFLKNEIIGTTSLREFDAELKEEDLKAFSEEGKCMLACCLIIKPFFRNVGFAKMITEFAEDGAKDNNIAYLRTIISIHNDPANKLAKETGYVLVKSNVENKEGKCNLWEKRIS